MEEQMKICTKCGHEKSKGLFFKKTARTDGLTSWCKLCCQKASAEYRRNNREKCRVWEKRYSEKYPSRAKEKTEKSIVKLKIWKSKNLDRARKSNRESEARRRKNNLEVFRKKSRDSQKKASEILSDGYIRYRLCQNSNLKANDIPDILIDLKRMQIRIKRAIKNENSETTS